MKYLLKIALKHLLFDVLPLEIFIFSLFSHWFVGTNPNDGIVAGVAEFFCSNPLLCYTAKILYWLILILTKWNTSCSAQILTNFQWWRSFKGIFIGRDSHHCRGEAALSPQRLIDSSCPFVNGHLSEISMTIKNVAQRR